MKIVAVVQARMGSTRLPGKVLKDLGGQTVLARVISRVRRCALLSEVVVATSTDSGDDIILRVCRDLKIEAFRGSEQDVLDRYFHAAQHTKADVVVRITSDCPLIDWEVTHHTIQQFLESYPDYASNALERTYPRGLDTEVMTASALERAWREACDPYQRAHVTPYLYQNPGVFRLLAVKNDVDYSLNRWTLDTLDDLKFLREIYSRFENRDDFSWRDVLALTERDPTLAGINRHIVQKELHEG